MTNTNEKCLIPLPDEILEEMADILESNFDYENTVDFDDPDEFVDHYGQKLYDKTIEIFKEKWYRVLGEAIQYGFPSFQECLVEALNAETREDIQKQAAEIHKKIGV